MADYPDNIKYNQTDNKITVIGFSSNTPGNFTDLYDTDVASAPSASGKGTNADRKGLLLESGNGQGNGLAVNDQAMLLAETCGQLVWVFVQSATHVGKTVDFHGTDINGNLDENAVAFHACTGGLAGSWIYATSIKKFKTMVTIDLNGMGGNVNFEVYQERWGVVWRGDIFYNDHYFKVTSFIHLGDANNDAHFGDKNKVVFFMADWVSIITSEAGKGHIYLGERSSVGDKTGKNGCIFKANVYMGAIIKDPIELNCYDSVFSNDAPWTGFTSIDLNGTSGEIWNSRFNNVDIKGSANNMDLYGITISDSVDVGFGDFLTNGIMYNISVYECKTLFEVYPGGVINIKNVIGKHIYNYLGLFFQDNAESHYAINWDVSWNPNDYLNDLFYWSGACPNAIIYRQYTFNLKVTDKDGNGIGNATVVLKDKDGNTADQKGFETTTSNEDATKGEITEQTVSYGYYNQANGNTLQSYSPHTLEIKKAGYQTYKKKFTLDEKTDWKIKLSHSPYNNILGID